jgi:hypothetical protein
LYSLKKTVPPIDEILGFATKGARPLIENNIYKIYLDEKFLISLPIDKGFGFPFEKSFPSMLQLTCD